MAAKKQTYEQAMKRTESRKRDEEKCIRSKRFVIL